MTREPPYRHEVEPTAPLPRSTRATTLPWSTLAPLALVTFACLARVVIAFTQRERWGAEPTLALVAAMVSALLLVSDVRAWRRGRWRS